MRKRALTSISVAAVVLTLIACSAAGCGGGDDSSGLISTDAGNDAASDVTTAPDTMTPPDNDSGMDATIDDAPSDTNPPPPDAKDGATTDATADANDGSACVGTNTACGTGDLCKASVCSPCTDPADDGLCTAAYASDGGADAGASSFICKAGTCTAGNCRTSATCTGELCGVPTANFCGSCATDTQCKADATYGAATICNPTLGTCVTNACANPNAACAANAADFCCAVAAVNTCVPGNCCTNAQCVAATPACTNNTCLACDAVPVVVAGGISTYTYTVDPVNGNDTRSGSGLAGAVANGACAFKTVARAITVSTALTATAGTAARIVVLGPNTISNAATGEVFPWTIPVNTALSSMGGAVTANVTASADGVRMRQPNSSIQGFILDGQTNTAVHGILASNSSSSTTTSVRAVTTRNFLDAGIRIEGTGGLAIGPGTASTGNGIGGGTRSGLRITDTGIAIISSATDAITFNNNTAAGIEVDLQGSVTITGTPGVTLGTGTVVANGNNQGLAVAQTPSAGAPPINTVTGLVAFQNTFNGVLVLGGSNLKVRGSRLVSNAIGVNIQPVGSAVAWNDDTSRIDFGQSAAADPGRNVLQSLAGAGQNTSAGVCYGINPNRSQTLYTYGNTWVSLAAVSASVDCALVGSAAVTLSKTPTCTAGVDIGGQGQINNTVGIAFCQ